MWSRTWIGSKMLKSVCRHNVLVLPTSYNSWFENETLGNKNSQFVDY